MTELDRRRRTRLWRWTLGAALAFVALLPVAIVGMLAAFRCDGHSICDGFDASAADAGVVAFCALVLDAAMLLVLAIVGGLRRRSNGR
ncbi:hypothetical protein [Paraconexibacter sp. AEG42_29]|uniref:hypothetical protein n=1 Tax=Paraconexibacter sp. AEG42_29 TaxID=2997339 RepID=UPI00339D3832